MPDGELAIESARADFSALADFSRLAASLTGSTGASIELLDGSSVQSGGRGEPAVETPILVDEKGVGQLTLFAPRLGTESLEPLLRRLAHHIERAEAFAMAVHANGVAASAVGRFEALFESVPVPCYSVDVRGRLMEWNAAAKERWGAEIALGWGDDPSATVRPEDVGAERALVARALTGENAREAGRSAFALRDATGTVVGAIVTAV